MAAVFLLAKFRQKSKNQKTKKEMILKVVSPLLKVTKKKKRRKKFATFIYIYIYLVLIVWPNI